MVNQDKLERAVYLEIRDMWSVDNLGRRMARDATKRILARINQEYKDEKEK